MLSKQIYRFGYFLWLSWPLWKQCSVGLTREMIKEIDLASVPLWFSPRCQGWIQSFSKLGNLNPGRSFFFIKLRPNTQMCKYPLDSMANVPVNDNEWDLFRWTSVPIIFHLHSRSGEHVNVFPQGLLRQQGWIMKLPLKCARLSFAK